MERVEYPYIKQPNKTKVQEDLNFLSMKKPFKSELNLKKEIVYWADKVVDAYANRAKRTHTLAPFSNQIDNDLRRVLLHVMSDKYQIHSDKEKEALWTAINKFISINYFEYKINKIMY